MTTEPITTLPCGGTAQATTSTRTEFRTHPAGYLLGVSLLAWWTINQSTKTAGQFLLIRFSSRESYWNMSGVTAGVLGATIEECIRPPSAHYITIRIMSISRHYNSLPDDYYSWYTFESRHFPTQQIFGTRS